MKWLRRLWDWTQRKDAEWADRIDVSTLRMEQERLVIVCECQHPHVSHNWWVWDGPQKVGGGSKHLVFDEEVKHGEVEEGLEEEEPSG